MKREIQSNVSGIYGFRKEDGPKQHSLWRQDLARKLSSNTAQYLIITLVILDSLIVIFELLIDLEIIIIPENDPGAVNGSDYNTTTSTMSPVTLPVRKPRQSFMLSNDRVKRSSRSEDGGSAKIGPNKHLIQEVLHFSSLTILSCFMVEVITKVLAEGTYLLHHKAEVFDAVVVVVSFSLDVFFLVVPVSQAAKDYSGLLVILRLWRVTRIINGVILSVKMDSDKKLRAEKALRKEVELQVECLTKQVDILQKENALLRARLQTVGDKSLSPAQSESAISSKSSTSLSTSGRQEENGSQESGRESMSIFGESGRESTQEDMPFLNRSGNHPYPHSSQFSTPNPLGQKVVMGKMGGIWVPSLCPLERSVFGTGSRSGLCSLPLTQQLLPFDESLSTPHTDITVTSPLTTSAVCVVSSTDKTSTVSSIQ